MANFPPTPEFIKSLDPNSPINENQVLAGDDWFRFVQQVLENQFPTSEDDSANGWDIALTVKASEVNSLLGITGVVESRLDALEADAATMPSTTRLMFPQVAAPTGWTQLTDTEVTGLDNSMLRVVQTAGGGLGGTDSPIQQTGAQVPQHTHSTSTPSGGSHDHEVDNTDDTSGGIRVDRRKSQSIQGNTLISQDGYVNSTGSTHTHPAGTSGQNGSNATWEPKYFDMILATKD